MRRLRPDSAAFTLLLGALVTLASFATDMSLPVLASTARSLGVEPATAALTLSIFMVGFSLGPLLAGPLSDRYGRRPLLLAACATFAIFGVLGAFSGSLGALLLWRFLMGAGAGACQVLVTATVRDLFEGDEARARQSYVNLAAGLAPILAPTIGVWVAAVGGWRAIYGVLAGGGMALLLLVALGYAEPARHRGQGPLTVRGTLGSYALVLRNRVTLGYVLVMALCYGALFTYVTSSSLVLIELLGVSRQAYGLLFASTASGLMVGALVSARLSRRGVPHSWLLRGGLATLTGAAVLLLVLSSAGMLGVGVLIPLLVLGNVGQGVVRPQAIQGALAPVPAVAGVASAVLTCLQMLAGAGASAVAAALFDGRTAVAMTGTMAACSIGAMVAYALVVRPAEARERAAPVVGEELRRVGAAA